MDNEQGLSANFTSHEGDARPRDVRAKLLGCVFIRYFRIRPHLRTRIPGSMFGDCEYNVIV